MDLRVEVQSFVNGRVETGGIAKHGKWSHGSAHMIGRTASMIMGSRQTTTKSVVKKERKKKMFFSLSGSLLLI